MRDVLAIAVAATAATAGALLVNARRWQALAPIETLAVVRFLTLMSAVALPLALTVCAATLLRGLGHASARPWTETTGLIAIGLYGLALLFAARLVRVGFRLFRTTRAAELRGAAVEQARRIPLDSRRRAFVVRADEPLAYATGLGRGQIVVSDRMLELLSGEERRALLAHELAHLRGGHQRLIFLGGVVAEALGFVPPVRKTFAALRRELEAAADADAVVTVGDPRVVASAIAKAALAGVGRTVPSLAGGDLRFRLRQLAARTRPTWPATLAASAGAGLLAATLVLAVCLALHAGPLPGKVAFCLAPLAALALPPLLGHGRVESVAVCDPGPEREQRHAP